MSEKQDVIIVGAGLSGLQTALDLHQAGRRCLILEARDRVGGKTWSASRKDGKGIQENGAAWVNDSNQSHVWEYCTKFGLTPVVQNVVGTVASEDENGNCHFFPFGGLPNFPQSELDNISQLRDKVEVASLDPATFREPNRAEIDKLSFEQWCRREGAGSRALQTATLWCRGTLGQDPCEVSALAFLEIARGALGIINLRYDGRHGAQHLRIKEGTQSIALNMARLLPEDSILLNSPVRSIEKHTPRSFTVTTSTGKIFKASQVVVSVPGPAYKYIEFNPPLPPLKAAYTSTVRYGFYYKYICLFKTPFWRRKGSCGLAQSFKGPLNHCRDTSVDADNNFALTCFVTASPGRKWFGLDADARKADVLRQIASLFQVSYEEVKSEFIESMAAEWVTDKWAGFGCPFAAPPPGVIGAANDGAHATESSKGMYFVGTEFTNEWRGYMEGAIRSGKRGAAQVLADFSETSQL